MTPSIVCGVDFTTPAGAVRVAAELAHRLDVRLVLAHAVVDVLEPRARNEAERALIRANEIAAAMTMLRTAASDADVDDAEFRCGVCEPVEWLKSIARDESAEMIVVAPRDLHPLRKLVSGSVSSALARGADCPVLAVPQPVLRRADELEPR
jgi:nucleotide-binding universal stress UspA family protein